MVLQNKSLETRTRLPLHLLPSLLLPIHLVQPPLDPWQYLGHWHLLDRGILRGIVSDAAVEQFPPVLAPDLTHAGQQQPVYICLIASILASVAIQPIESRTKAATELCVTPSNLLNAP